MAQNPRGEPCPCGSGSSYTDCCGQWHAGAVAPDAEALMRSRYSAYVRGLHDYLLATWHASTRPTEVGEEAIRWLALEVKNHTQQDDTHATVEFVARYRTGGRGHRLHETSRFVREGGRWYYLDGDFADA